jgi:hypothetical protein
VLGQKAAEHDEAKSTEVGDLGAAEHLWIPIRFSRSARNVRLSRSLVARLVGKIGPDTPVLVGQE